MPLFTKSHQFQGSAENERIQFALEAADTGIWDWDIINDSVWLNEHCKKLIGFSGDDIAAYSEIRALIHTEDIESTDLALEKALDPAGGHQFDVSFRLKTGHHDITEHWLHFKGKAIFDENGNPYRLSGIARDVTHEIKNRDSRFNNLLENAQDVITRWDKNAQLIFANSVFYIKKAAVNASLPADRQLIDTDFPGSPCIEHIKHVFSTGEVQEHFTEFPTPFGKVIFHSKLVPEAGQYGAVQSVLAISRDITELRTSEGRFQTMIEQSPMAIGLLRGREMVIEIANDRIYEVWGKSRSMTGMRLIELLPEIEGQMFIPLLENVYDTGEPYFGNGTPAKLIRNGRLEDVYFDFVYSPLRETNGTVTGIMILAIEVTAQVIARKTVEESEAKFRSLIEEAPVATCLFTGRDMKIELANEMMIGYWGKGNSVIGKRLEDAVPELKGQPFLKILDEIFTTGKSYEAKNSPTELIVNGVRGTYYFDYTYKPLLNAQGEVYAIMDMAVDVTEQVIASKAVEASEAKLRTIIATAPAAMGLFVGRDLIVEIPNRAFIAIVGKGPDIVGKPLREVMPELENQAFLQILDDVFTSGKMYQSYGTQVNIVQQGVMTYNFYNITYSPLMDADGNVYAILDIAIDVTETIKAKQKLEESEFFSRSIIDNSPVAKAVFIGDDMIIRTVNENMLRIMRQDASITGKSLIEIMPGLAGIPLLGRLKQVLQSGETLYQPEEKIELIRNEKPYTAYFNFIYKALHNTSGDLYGVIVTATEVTEQVLSRQKIQETESDLRGAVELAELGTWQIDLHTRIMEYSPRLREWFGIGQNEIITVETAYKAVSEQDRARIRAAFVYAITPGNNGFYDIEYKVEEKQINKERILHSQGRAFFDENGKAFKLSGTVQDITEQRKAQLALEQEVQQRTRQLQASIHDLQRSNQNLQQFAYIASHDLQEPLRKIQSFGDLLKKRFESELGEGINYLQRMQTAASRMSILIEDLLTFSRISTQQEASDSVNLNELIKTITRDLDLSILETGTVIDINMLPVVQGDESQLGQLFQNLISNAIKFHDSDTAPSVQISAQIVALADLSPEVKPIRVTDCYHRIDVSDNGIGFDEKYLDRIFQVFQRLHGKNEFAGTGIGLAICEKVASNHGGAITAKSQPGQGATFSLYLPVSSNQ